MQKATRKQTEETVQIADFSRPITTVEVVIFTVLEDRLCVLQVQRPTTSEEPYPGLWALPGGFVNIEKDHSLLDCAKRKLKEKTGITSPYLEQLGSWGDDKRDPRGWSATHVFFALIPSSLITLEKGANAANIGWFEIIGEKVKQRLAFDHQEILRTAILRMRSKAEYTSLPVYLLPEEFTLSELQRTYEIVLGRPVEKSAFRTRVLKADLVKEANGMREGSNRPAQLYCLQKPEKLVYFPRTFNPQKD